MTRSMMTALLFAVALSVASAQTISPSESTTSAVPVNSAELIAKAELWDGKEILFEGEAIGPPLRRGERVWVNVLDSNAAMGVFLSSGTARTIRNFGSYERRGDTLRARGVFRRACPDHGGDMDIHASSLEIIAVGKPIPHPVDQFRLALAPAFLSLAAILFLIWRKRRLPFYRSRALRPPASSSPPVSPT